MTTFTPAYAPSYGASYATKYRVLQNDFGDGYDQTVQDGLNNVQQIWEVPWNNISDENAQDILTQLDALAGKVFEWLTPNGETKKFRCKSVNQSFVGFQTRNISATFEESFSQ
jgi:phage-related protein